MSVKSKAHRKGQRAAERLIRRAIEIIQEERDATFQSYRVPGTVRVPDADARAELRKLDAWLKKAKAVVE